MRRKRSRIRTYYVKSHVPMKDSEGGSYDSYGEPVECTGEDWPASGKVQAQVYGQRLSYIRNMRIIGNYKFSVDEKKKLHYVFEGGLDISENCGICIDVPADAGPDYRVISIKPYRELLLEVEKI